MKNLIMKPAPESLRYLAFTAATLALLSISLSAPAKAARDIVWDMGLLERFDPSNKAYPIADGQVTVDLHKKTDLCPTGLGHLADGRKSVKEIVINYTVTRRAQYWLHIKWSPGGSGKEQFEVTLDGEAPQTTPIVTAAERPYMRERSVFVLNHDSGKHTLRLRHLSGDGLSFDRLTLAGVEDTDSLPQTLRPQLLFPTLDSYEKEIGESAMLVDGAHVRLYAPAKKTKEAKVVARYLERAYKELFRLVGIHTKFKIVVYHFPEENPHWKGGTSECAIWYGYGNLDFDSHTEWKRHKVPHLSGYIEEMSHNFAPLVTFGWEMVGWHVSRIITEKVAGNDTHREHIERTRQTQAETFEEYRRLGNVFPLDLPGNVSDRIHAHLLWECERNYGKRFWSDFHAEVRAIYPRLEEAARMGDRDAIKNERYRLTLECLVRLDEKRRLLHKKQGFKEMLTKYGISLTRDVTSLNPTDKGWNRKLK